MIEADHDLLDAYDVPRQIAREHSGGAMEDAAEGERLHLSLSQWQATRQALIAAHLDENDPAGAVQHLRRTIAELQAGLGPMPEPRPSWTPGHWQAAAQWLFLVALAGCAVGSWLG